MFLLLGVASRSISEARSSIFPIVREEGWARARRARFGAAIAALIAIGAASGFFGYAQPILLDLRINLSEEATRLAEMLTAKLPAAQTDVIQTVPSSRQAENEQTTGTIIPTFTLAAPSTVITPAATPTQPDPTATISPTPTLTPSPTVMLQRPTPTPTSRASPVPTPSATPSPIPERSPVPPPPNATMGPITFAVEIDGRRMPVNPTQVFSSTMKRIYAVFPFSGMREGVPWTQVWYYNGLEFAREEGTWEWGSQDRSYIFVKPVGAGTYRLELYVSSKLLASGEFTVLGPTAVGGPYNP